MDNSVKHLEKYFKNQTTPFEYFFSTNGNNKHITYNGSIPDLVSHLYLTGCSFVETRSGIPVFEKSTIFPYYPIFSYFSTLGVDFENKSVLDFGGNNGNLIRSSNNKIQDKMYTCVDIDKQGLSDGEQSFPNAKWMHYNRYHPVYNKLGDKTALPNIEQYDIIIANSVFNHFTNEEILFFVDYLYNHLTPSGKFYFTWCNIDNEYCFNTFKKIRSPIFSEFEKPISKTYAYMCNNKQADSIIEGTEYLLTFHNKDYLLELLENYNPKHYDAFSTWPLDCIEIEKVK